MNEPNVIVPNNMSEAIVRGLPGEDPLELLKRCGGLGNCTRAENQPTSGPVIVAEFTMDFAKAEQHPPVVTYLASILINQALELIPQVDVFCGLWELGSVLAYSLATTCNRRYSLLGPVHTGRHSRRAEFIWHSIQKGDRVAVVADELTSEYLMQANEAVSKSGGELVGAFCFCDCLPEGSWHKTPVVSIVRKVAIE